MLVGVSTATTFLNRAHSQRVRFDEQRRTVRVLSRLVLRKTADETEDWLRLFFEPVERELRVVRDWSHTGAIDIERLEDTKSRLAPIVEHYPQISSFMLADDRGREHMLLRVSRDQSGLRETQWKCRETRRDQWQDEVRWIEWNGGQRGDERRRAERLDYDPRLRSWFQGAHRREAEAGADAESQSAVHWTEPYVFFTTKDLGITASMRASTIREDDHGTVVAFDILLADITRFTIGKRPTSNGKVLVLTEQGGLVGLPSDPSWQSPADWKRLFLQPLKALDAAYARDAAESFSVSMKEGTRILSFHSGGSIWWGAARPFRLGNHELAFWILVLLPESDLHDSLAS